MRNDNYIDLGEEISKTVKKVLNAQDFYDLKNTINRTMRNIPGMGGGPLYNGPFGDDFPPLSKEDPGNKQQNRQQYKPQYGQPYSQQYGQKYKQHKRYRGANSVPSTLMIVFGSIGAAVTGLLMLIGAAFEAYLGDIPGVGMVSAVFGVPFLIFISLIIAGTRLKKRLKRFRLYQNVLNGRTYCTIRELSSAGGRKPEFIVKDLRRMIHAGLFPEGYLDQEETCLMTDYKTYTQYLETMKYAEEQRAAEKKENEKWANREGGEELRKTIEEGKDYIRAIKAANDALPEEEISDKLDQLELVTTKIFNYVEQHPEKLPEIRKFMCYYMPITLKLVNAYQKFDRHGMNASEIESTKLEIKGTIDTINKAYENLLKKLMKADILDVTSDISALETILAQEGLTGDNFTSLKEDMKQ